jgi:predicted peptidase
MSLLLTVLLVPAPDVEHGFLDRVYKGDDGVEARYVVFVPHGHTGEQPCPAVLFLHGSGSTGDDGRKQVAGISAANRLFQLDVNDSLSRSEVP